MRQNRMPMGDGREHGFPICANGGLSKGPESVGHRYGVKVSTTCPPGTRLVGLYHSHPGGIPEPSLADIREAARFRIPNLCIGVPEQGIIKCHRVLRRR